jgi:hypothetical protein
MGRGSAYLRRTSDKLDKIPFDIDSSRCDCIVNGHSARSSGMTDFPGVKSDKFAESPGHFVDVAAI